MSHTPPEEPVGSLAAEAAKFFGTFASWTSPQQEDAQPDSAQSQSGTEQAHDATGECRACPVCRTMAAVREVSPEVKAHLATAATSLLAAASALLSTVVDPTPRADPDRADPERADPDHPEA